MRLYAKKAVIGTLICLTLWLIFTYVTLTNSPLESRDDPADEEERFRNDLAQRVEVLERDFNEQLQINKNMLVEIKEKLLEEKQINLISLQNSVEMGLSQSEEKIAILVLACNRINVTRCIDLLIQYRPDKEKFPIIISQDCNHEPTRLILEKYVNEPDSGVSLIFQPDLTEIQVPPKEKKFRGYFHISRHYRFALNYTFYNLGYETVIIVEDDLDVSSDFYEYFMGTYTLLKNDPTLWCVSAWNDNGKVGLIDPSKPELLHRSDFFPGLGWMLRKQLWDELQPKWPPAYWDDWIRKPEQRKDRACIRPELPRTKTFGKIGVSNGLFFEKYLKFIQLNDQSVPFTKMNLSYLMKNEYDRRFMDDVNSATEVTLTSLRGMKDASSDPASSSVRLTYTSKEEYKKMARHLGLMEDFRSGVGRTAYLGVVNCFYKGRRVYIAPDKPNFVYDPQWN